MKPVIGITTGCPCGIGPEIVAKAVADPRVLEICELRVFGAPLLCKEGKGEVETLPPLTPPYKGGDNRSRECGLISMHAIESAVRAVMSGEVQAIVTAPINKSHWKAAGCKFPGHTEYLAHLSGAKSVAMMMASPKLKVSLVTTHIPLADVPKAITVERICEVARLTCASLRLSAGLLAEGALAPKQSPASNVGDCHAPSGLPPLRLGGRSAMTNHRTKIAICALNPHASDSGMFGDEEERIIIPAIEQLLSEGLNVSGPCPADTVFWKAMQGEFAAVVAMYHDQALVPIKTLDFKHTVNVTLGLPFIRTAPDHGTAEDIAGKGIASHENIVEAIKQAVILSEAKNLHR